MSTKFSSYLNTYKNGRRDDPLLVQKEINEQMQAYDLAEQKKRVDLLSQMGIPDEDGFIRAISPNTKFAAFRDVEIRRRERKTAKSMKIMPEFYGNSPYMVSKEKKREIEDIRKRFADDRRKIKELSDIL